MTSKHIKSWVSDMESRLSCAAGEVAMEAFEQFEEDRYCFMMTPKYARWIMKAKRLHVRDIEGWLADEIFNDAELIRDFFGDWSFDYSEKEEERQEIFKYLHENGREPVITAMEDLLGIKKIRYRNYKPLPKPKPRPKKVKPPLPDPPEKFGKVSKSAWRFLQSHGEKRYKAWDGWEYIRIKSKWYKLEQ